MEHTITDPTIIDVCICTFRRESIVAAMMSVGSQIVPPGYQLRLVIADNDVSPSAEARVKAAAEILPIPVHYVHAPAQNISVARNACLDNAHGHYLVFLDDDEIATSGWLAALIARKTETGAGMVLGPVQAIYPADCPAWMRDGDFHSFGPVWVQGRIITGYTSNLLIDRLDPAVQGLRFDPALGRTGGEDTSFCSAFYRAGGTIVYADHAVVTEIVPPGRATLNWLVTRRFRSGQTHGYNLTMGTSRFSLSWFRYMGLAFIKAIFCATMMAFNFYSDVKWRFWFLRGALHVGVMARLLGQRELKLY